MPVLAIILRMMDTIKTALDIIKSKIMTKKENKKMYKPLEMQKVLCYYSQCARYNIIFIMLYFLFFFSLHTLSINICIIITYDIFLLSFIKQVPVHQSASGVLHMLS